MIGLLRKSAVRKMPKIVKPDDIPIRASQQAIDQGLRELLAEAKGLYLGTYHNWESENRPEWKTVGPKTVDGSRVLDYETASTPFVWVDDGTKGPYTIAAKNAPFLMFQVGGSPKTFKGSLMSTSGNPGTAWRSAKEVTHPGIEEREFSQTVADRLDEHASVTVQSKINKVG